MKKLLAIVVAVMALQSSYAQQEILLLKTSGKVVIGDTTLITTPGNYNLYVQNGILTERVKVALKNESDWSDDAWDITPTLSEIEKSIEDHKHLLHMPSATELVETGYEVTEMDAKLLAQIEWLWQHTIKINRENEMLRKELNEIKKLLQKQK